MITENVSSLIHLARHLIYLEETVYPVIMDSYKEMVAVLEVKPLVPY